MRPGAAPRFPLAALGVAAVLFARHVGGLEQIAPGLHLFAQECFVLRRPTTDHGDAHFGEPVFHGGRARGLGDRLGQLFDDRLTILTIPDSGPSYPGTSRCLEAIPCRCPT